MRVKHRIVIHAVCPVNQAEDHYDCTVAVRDRVLTCEEVIGCVDELTKEPIFQEHLTQKLADCLRARVKTVGAHADGRVKTTVVCRPCVRAEDPGSDHEEPE
jgi:hypothetical protein